MATCEDGIRTRGAGRVRGPCFCARKTRGNRGNIGIAPPPESECWGFAQSGGWRLTLGQMVGNVKGNEGNDDRRALTSAVVVRVDDAAAARPPPPAKAAGVAAMLMGATTHGQ